MLYCNVIFLNGQDVKRIKFSMSTNSLVLLKYPVVFSALGRTLEKTCMPEQLYSLLILCCQFILGKIIKPGIVYFLSALK